MDVGAGQDVQVGAITLRLSRDAGGALVGEVAPGPVDLSRATATQPIGQATGQPGGPPAGAEAPEQLLVEGLAPFAVAVQRSPDGTTTLMPLRVQLPEDTLRPAVGSGVLLADGGVAEVVEVQDQTLLLRSRATRSLAGPLPNPDNRALPFIVLWLVSGAVYFTLRMGFISLRGFRHAIEVTAGHYDKEGDPGEISHFQALSSALSATVGLGNIAGVAVAVGVGGPGAIFWMIVAGFLGMSAKFTECTLGQMYRVVDARGHVSGGPMRYLHAGLQERGLGGLGRVLALVFAVMCIGGSFGGGNMFQANQSYVAVADVIPWFADHAWVYGVGIAVLTALVIIGGIKSIGAAASVIVPVMCAVYLLAGIYILVVNAGAVPAAFGAIVEQAFTPEAGRGGLLGVLVQGFRRAAFSNEAGIGSASIAHSAAATDEPVREGVVALLEPFIDTIVICTMTGLVVVVTGAYQSHPGEGVLMTSAAFASALPWFPVVLSLAVFLFAFSTMISWSYYGERCWTFLFGEGSSMVYKVLFLFAAFFGAVFKLGNVLDFSDLMVLGMAFPNILGLFLLSGKVRGALDDYWGRLQSGQMKRVR